MFELSNKYGRTDKIISLLADYNLSKAELARRLGMAKSSLSYNLENGLSIEKFRQYCNAIDPEILNQSELVTDLIRSSRTISNLLAELSDLILDVAEKQNVDQHDKSVLKGQIPRVQNKLNKILTSIREMVA